MPQTRATGAGFMSDDIFASADYAAGRARFVEPDKATPAKAAPGLFGTAKVQWLAGI
jgi:hypothetical protein